jgi:hypothetical protein
MCNKNEDHLPKIITSITEATTATTTPYKQRETKSFHFVLSASGGSKLALSQIFVFVISFCSHILTNSFHFANLCEKC